MPWAQLNEDFFEGGRQKRQLTKSQKIANKYKWRVRQGGLDEKAGHSMNLMVERLQCLQEDNEGDVNSVGKGFLLQKGLLNRRWQPPGWREEVKQSVLPKHCHGGVMHLAHEIPLAGQMGKNKTAHRILKRFYWPSLF